MVAKSRKYTKKGGSSGAAHLSKMGLGTYEGQLNKVSNTGSLVGGSKKRRKHKKGGFGKHLVPLALVGAQQYAKKKRGKLMVVGATRKLARMAKLGLKKIGKTAKRIGKSIKKTFSRKKR
tara:strand:- start:678 stop:1037 length:360 start_codon:yes stop_codon:yes gene_type:complete